MFFKLCTHGVTLKLIYIANKNYGKIKCHLPVSSFCKNVFTIDDLVEITLELKLNH